MAPRGLHGRQDAPVDPARGADRHGAGKHRLGHQHLRQPEDDVEHRSHDHRGHRRLRHLQGPGEGLRPGPQQALHGVGELHDGQHGLLGGLHERRRAGRRDSGALHDHAGRAVHLVAIDALALGRGRDGPVHGRAAEAAPDQHRETGFPHGHRRGRNDPQPARHRQGRHAQGQGAALGDGRQRPDRLLARVPRPDHGLLRQGVRCGQRSLPAGLGHDPGDVEQVPLSRHAAPVAGHVGQGPPRAHRHRLERHAALPRLRRHHRHPRRPGVAHRCHPLLRRDAGRLRGRHGAAPQPGEQHRGANPEGDRQARADGGGHPPGERVADARLPFEHLPQHPGDARTTPAGHGPAARRRHQPGPGGRARRPGLARGRTRLVLPAWPESPRR